MATNRLSQISFVVGAPETTVVCMSNSENREKLSLDLSKESVFRIRSSSLRAVIYELCIIYVIFVYVLYVIFHFRYKTFPVLTNFISPISQIYERKKSNDWIQYELNDVIIKG